MYPSLINNNGNYYNDPSSSNSFLLPSPIYIPLEDEAVFYEFFQQQLIFPNEYNNHYNSIVEPHDDDDQMPNMESTILEECSNNNGRVETEIVSSPKIRTCKRDRHSKINTARGPRDRRMRLSLDVAKKLFGLQDLLGFDKASKTVDWLLTKSKTAILELLPDRSCSFMGVTNSASSTSECEVLSGTADIDQCLVIKTGDDQATNNKSKSCSGSSKKKKEKVSRVRKCADFHHPLAKATRERARERARERTMEKRNNNKHFVGQDSNFRPCFDQAMDQDANPLGSWITIEENQRQNIGQMNSNYQVNQGFVGDNSSLLMTSNWTPSYLFNEHQFSELEINEKAWEGSNN